jgi:hypothetical protein
MYGRSLATSLASATISSPQHAGITAGWRGKEILPADSGTDRGLKCDFNYW